MTHALLELKQNLFIAELQLGDQEKWEYCKHMSDKIGCSKLTGHEERQGPSLYSWDRNWCNYVCVYPSRANGKLPQYMETMHNRGTNKDKVPEIH